MDLSRPGARAALFRRYEDEMLPAAEESQERVAQMLKDRPSALLCFEARPADCHRGTLARVVEATTGLAARHL